MPIYNFRDRETQEIIELELSMKEREEYLQDNPCMEQVILKAPVLGDSISLGVTRPPAWITNKIRHLDAKIPKRLQTLGNRKLSHNVSEI